MVRGVRIFKRKRRVGERDTMLLEIRSRLGLIPLVLHYNASMYVCTPTSSPAPAVPPEKSANDEVERRGSAPCQNEGSLSRSSTILPDSTKAQPAIAPTDC